MSKNIEINVFNGSTYEVLYPKTLGSLVDGTVSRASLSNGLTTRPTIRTDLSSTTAEKFNGIDNITPGITGTLAISHGGTGATAKANALNNLGITYGTSDLTAGSSTLATGTFYFVYK